MTLSASLEALEALSVGFRQRYLDHDEVSRQLAVWHVAFPEFTRLASLGRSAEGRDLWCLAIGRTPDAAQPATGMRSEVRPVRGL